MLQGQDQWLTPVWPSVKGDPTAAHAHLQAIILEPESRLSTSATRRSVIPDHGHHLVSLICLPNLAQGMYLPSGHGGNSVTCGGQASRESWKCLAF